MSAHNLDINNYSLEEIFGLFELDYNLTDDAMRAAKKKVLMTHPDKSRLPSHYFHFYKQAYEIVLNIYKQKSKFNDGAAAPAAVAYSPNVASTKSVGNVADDDHVAQQIAAVAKKMDGGAFNSKFNELYDKNMVRKTDTSRYDWFKQAEPVLDDFSNKHVNPKNMGAELENVKQRQAALQVYKGVQEMRMPGGGATSCYDDDETDEYVACDVFGKLKFDDLRKVHKDQTVFAVSEKDYDKRPQYKTVEQFVKDRDAGGGATPLAKDQAASLLARQQKEHEQSIMNKQHRDYMLQKEYEEKQKTVRAAFLQLR
jgi:cation transport regulator ChaB